jgi:hypothetical protein
MNRFLAALASRARAIVTPGNCEKRGLPHPGQKFAHQRGLKLEPLEERTLLSASWDEPKGSTIYVDDTAVGLDNGTSWANAYASLQTAITTAVSGDEIHVAQGTYKPTMDTDRTKNFALKNDVSILGGYAGAGATDPDARDVTGTPSVLSGDIGGGSTADNSYHVVVGNGTNSTAVLDGFTITAGNANGTSTATYGGEMYNEYYSSPTLTNCIVWGNTATTASQVYNSSSTPDITYCDVQGGYAGVKNINADPQFVRTPVRGPDGKWGTSDDDYGDLRLRCQSPCIDAGNNYAVSAKIAADLSGAPRFADASWIADTGRGSPPIVDLGAYERSGTNSVPTATVQISPAPATTKDVLTATATKQDADGDPVSLTFVWKVNGVEKQRTVAATALFDTFNLGLPGNGDKGDTISVEVVPNDGLLNGTTAVASIAVSDSLPSDAMLAPANVVENQPAATLVGVLSSTDPDENETFTYELVSGTGGDDNTSFQVDGDKLRTAGPLDFGVKSSYSIRVRTTDASGLSLEKPLSVAVLPTLDVDRNAAAGPLSDGLLILRHLFDFRGQSLGGKPDQVHVSLTAG